jgi:hypothetical protein
MSLEVPTGVRLDTDAQALVLSDGRQVAVLELRRSINDVAQQVEAALVQGGSRLRSREVLRFGENEGVLLHAEAPDREPTRRWWLALLGGPRVTVLLRAEYPLTEVDAAEAPLRALLTSARWGGGAHTVHKDFTADAEGLKSAEHSRVAWIFNANGRKERDLSLPTVAFFKAMPMASAREAAEALLRQFGALPRGPGRTVRVDLVEGWEMEGEGEVAGQRAVFYAAAVQDAHAALWVLGAGPVEEREAWLGVCRGNGKNLLEA